MATARAERRLAAILAADVVGYSRLMERDEQGTLERLKAHRTQFVEPLIAEHRGRIVKLMGDGALIEFASVVDAVACAVAVQEGMAARDRDLPEAERIRFRIGINLGDVIVEGDDLYGDGVNVAARLEQLCEPGGVLVSGTAYDQLQGKLGLPLEFTGEQRVKNIERPVRTYRVRLDGKVARLSLPRLSRRALATAAALCLILAVAAGWWWAKAPVAPFRPLVAVLPFATPAGGDPRLAKLADDLTTGVMDALSISRFWIVLGQGASFTYRDRPNAARALGQEQGATFVVEASLEEAGQRLRAAVQLVEARTGERLWSTRFDRPSGDWSVAQDELGGRIGNALYEDGLRKIIGNRAAVKPIRDLEAYELVQLAAEQSGKMNREANAKGLELIGLALTRDPRSGAALLWQARLYRQQVDQGYAPEAEAMARWGEAARTLVDLDPNYPWGHALLATWYSYTNKQDDITLAEFDRAIELAPNNPGLLAEVAEQLPWHGQSERAAELLDRAARFNPELRFNWRQYQVGFFLGRFREAANLIGDFTEFSRWDLLFATLCHAQLGNAAETARWRARFVESWPDYSFEPSYADFSPAAAKERALWLDSNAKAGLTKCAAPEQIAAQKITPLPECEAARAKITASRP